MNLEIPSNSWAPRGGGTLASATRICMGTWRMTYSTHHHLVIPSRICLRPILGRSFVLIEICTILFGHVRLQVGTADCDVREGAGAALDDCLLSP